MIDTLLLVLSNIQTCYYFTEIMIMIFDALTVSAVVVAAVMVVTLFLLMRCQNRKDNAEC
jgi:hypothetical protein